MRNQLLAGAAAVGSRFAHLAGIGGKPASAKAAEDDDKDKDKDENASATAAAADDEDDEDKDKNKKGKKGKAASDDDDERAEDDDDKKEARGYSKGVAAERQRVAAVLGSPLVTRNLAMAAALLCESDMSAESIVKALKASSIASASADRRERNPRIDAASDATPSSREAIAASWDRAAQKAGVIPRK